MIFAFIAQIIGELVKGTVSGKFLTLDLMILTGWNWYIYEVITLYLIFYIANKFVKSANTREVLFWITAFTICILTLYFCKHGKWEGWTSAYYFSTFSFPLGITISLHFEKIQGYFMRHSVLKSFILLCTAICSCLSLVMPKDSVIGGIFLRNIMGGCIMLILFIVTNYVDVSHIAVVSRIVLFLTKFSAEIYLYQFCLLDLWALVYDRLGWNIDLSYVCVVMVSTIALGYVMHLVDLRISKAVKV